ncbi:DUF6624 domain-containing protein [Brevundimonas sp.]|uniref:DUF6624 domain-containing protein n=1 Tax=Brevundimonas sp. TaxID=1871086 RepID=UPI002FDADA13
MLIHILAALAILSDLSPAVRAHLAPFTTAVQDAEAKLQALPPDADVRERLIVMRQLDQAPMMAVHDLDSDGLSEAEADAARAEVDRELARLNAQNITALLAMIPEDGWFSSRIYGQEAATGAFLIIQHSDSVQQKRFLPAIETMVERGEALGSEYALMYDRIAVAEGRPQRYGTQMHCVAGRMVPQPIEDPERLEARRAPMGFRWSNYEAYLAMFGACRS